MSETYETVSTVPPAEVEDKREKTWFWDYQDVFLSDLSSQAKLVRMCLAMHADYNNRKAFPSLNTIAKECSMSKSSVVRAVEELEDKGWIKRKRRKNQTANYISTLYQLLPPPSPKIENNNSVAIENESSVNQHSSNNTGLSHTETTPENEGGGLSHTDTTQSNTEPGCSTQKQGLFHTDTTPRSNTKPGCIREKQGCVSQRQGLSHTETRVVSQLDSNKNHLTGIIEQESLNNDGLFASLESNKQQAVQEDINNINNKDLIAELTQKFFQVPGVEKRKGYYSMVGKAYKKYGYEAVLQGIEDLEYEVRGRNVADLPAMTEKELTRTFFAKCKWNYVPARREEESLVQKKTELPKENSLDKLLKEGWVIKNRRLYPPGAGSK